MLTWSTEPLTEDVVIAGALSAKLFASTTGTDADWVVKLIDVYPDTAEGDRRMGGYQLMVAGEIMRGRYRQSYERPAADRREPGRGIHRPDSARRRTAFSGAIVSWCRCRAPGFHSYDRNPQTFVPNIFTAAPADYKVRTHRIWRSTKYPSHVVLPVLPSLGETMPKRRQTYEADEITVTFDPDILHSFGRLHHGTPGCFRYQAQTLGQTRAPAARCGRGAGDALPVWRHCTA